MARLPSGGKKRRANRILNLIRGSFGVLESEIAEELNVNPRTVNNYVRELDADEKAHKKGHKWYAD